MARKGTVILLGAGASADAGYPTAAELLGHFKTALHETAEAERASAELIKEQIAWFRGESSDDSNSIAFTFPIRDTPTLEEWFAPLWRQFERASASVRPLAVPALSQDGRPRLGSSVFPGRAGIPSFAPYGLPLEGPPPLKISEPYLEDFFAFYDDLLRPRVRSVLSEFTLPDDAPHRFRKLRQIAIKVAYRSLTAYEHDVASYLEPLFRLDGPTGSSAPIATLNFDMSVEQLAFNLGLPFFDGFRDDMEKPSIPVLDDDLRNLRVLWNTVAGNLVPFVGFHNAPADTALLLKLHGSLGWFVLEEGNGDIGTREEMRHNTPYQFFRLPYEQLLDPAGLGGQVDADTLALGGQHDPVTRTPTGSLSRKAGAVWLRPYMLYAVAIKAHPDRVSLDLLDTFARLLSQARHLLVIGYSWSDAHINDLLLGAVAQGCALVNVGWRPMNERFLALWMQRLPTTYSEIATRLYGLGGGAKRVLAEQKVILPSDEVCHFDIFGALGGELPDNFSLAHQLGSTRLSP